MSLKLTRSALVMFAALVFHGEPSEAQRSSLRFFSNGGRPYKVSTLTFSPKSDILAISVAGAVSLVRPSDGEIVHQHKLDPFAMTFSTDGEQLLMISTRGIQLLRLDGYQHVDIRARLPLGLLGISYKLQGGKLLITASSSDKLGPGDELVGFKTDGRDRSLLGRPVEYVSQQLRGPIGSTAILRVIKKGQRQPIDVELRRRRPSGNNLPATFAPHMCIATFNGYISLFDPATGNLLSALTPQDVVPRGSQAVSPDGRFYGIVAKGLPSFPDRLYVEVFDLADQVRLFKETLPSRSLFDATFSPDGKSFLVGSRDSIYVLDIEREKFVQTIELGWKPKRRRDVKPSDNSRSATDILESVGAEVGNVSEAISPYPLLSCLAIAPPDLIAVGSPRGPVSVWSLSTGRELRRLTYPPNSTIEDIDLSPDGQWIAYFAGGTLFIDAISELRDTSKLGGR